MLSEPGLYVHYPWCVRKCPYCDFNSHPIKAGADFSQYTTHLLRDFRAQQISDVSFASVFLGGGTPSLCPAAHIERLLENVRVSDAAEITMEANPGAAEHENFASYRAAGVNRLSIGAQSFHAAHLQALGRIHGPLEVRRAFDGARTAGFDNINLDLMWGLPQQTPAQCVADLEAAIALGPEHISWYQLTIEPKTEFARRPPHLPNEDALAEMEGLGLQLLTNAGFERYEVSAYAKPTRRCRHNLNYWQFGDYAGIGAGAHGKQSSQHVIVRTRKASQPRLYTADPTSTDSVPVAQSDLALEFMLNVLRLVNGVEQTVFQARTGLPWTHIEPVWDKLLQRGLVLPDRCQVTPLGMRHLNTVTASFLGDG